MVVNLNFKIGNVLSKWNFFKQLSKVFFLTGCIKYLIGYLKTEKSWIENMTFAKCKKCE